jgi:antitoxin CptB
MADDLEIRRRRAAYRACHRGTKEMDLVLGRYAAARLSAMSDGELGRFERFLAMPDPVLSDWFTHGAAVDDAEFATLVRDLRGYHGLARGADTESEV